MASRYAIHQGLDYCLSPLRVLQHGEYVNVPCGKCNGCLVHKSNSWSMRLRQEIEATPHTIFFTLTYRNEYLPTLKIIDGDCDGVLVSNHKDNKRFNGVRDVLREDSLVLPASYYSSFKPFIQNSPRTDLIPYVSKRDIQLWLKLLREDLNNLSYGQTKLFRYYIISEYGPTTLRPHFHGLLFCKSSEVSEYLLRCSLFKNWQMCDKDLFENYTHYCDSGAAQYVTNYVTGNSVLPAIYRTKELRPFRLASKNPAVGFVEYDKKEVSQKISVGTLEYIRDIPRLESRYLLRYSKDYCITLFPKCYEFSLQPHARLLYLYGLLYREVVGRGIPYSLIARRLSKDFKSQDFTAMKKCYDFCVEFGCVPFHYLFLLDMYYYKCGMTALKMWYEWQQNNSSDWRVIFSSYSNLHDLFVEYFQLGKHFLSLRYFLLSYGIYLDDLNLSDINYICSVGVDNTTYELELEDILENSRKMPKFNELTGFAPTLLT